MNYDILIVGGGLVGASLVLGFEKHLKPYGLKVGLVDSKLLDNKVDVAVPKTLRYAHLKNSDVRTIALSDLSLRILRALSGYSFDVGASPIQAIHVSRESHFGAIRLKASDVGLKALGYSVEITMLLQKLYDAMQTAQCGLIAAQVKEAKQTLTGWRVLLNTSHGDEEIFARLLIAADGDHSILRQQLHIPVQTFDYAQSAMVKMLEVQKSLQDTAFERFIRDGSIALLPVEEKKAKLVWVGPTEAIKELMDLSIDEQCSQLKRCIGFRLGSSFVLGESAMIYSLKYQHAKEQVREGFVLMGNAAHTLHPVGAQGFNLSLRDITVLVETIRQAIVEAKDFASLEVLQQYLDQRLYDQEYVARFTHRLAMWFAGDAFFMPFLLFNTLECFPFLKRRLIRFSMGSFSKLPSWVFNGSMG